MIRTPGTIDPLFLVGRARDLKTDRDGVGSEFGRADLRATIEMIPRVVKQLAVVPPVPGLNLVGVPAMSGFRGAADRAAPRLRLQRDLRYALLDDVPVAALISGHALSASGVLGVASKSGYLPVADQCAGFVTGGVLMSSFTDGDPVMVTGPVAPPLESPDDELAWHEMPVLPIHGMRRRRRLDVIVDAGKSQAEIDAMFRDTYTRSDGRETIIHEYTIVATVDLESEIILHSCAVPRVLPWQECPGAVDSATRIVGMRLSDLHSRVRHELHGISTCTHLNDLLRNLADASALVAAAAGVQSDAR